MSDFLAWSFSRLKQFRECPRQTWHAAAAPKGHPDKLEFRQTPQMLAGLEIDNALTARIAKGVELPHKYAPYEGVCQMVLAAPGAKFTQLKVTLDQSYKPCGYFDKVAWVRSIYDCAIINGETGHVLDWKNGSLWLDEDQLRLFAATAFHQFPELNTIHTSYVWLKSGVTSDKTYTRRELPDLWQTFIPDVERMQVCYRTNTWPANPARGAKSCAYCAVNAQGKCDSAQGPYKG